MPRRRVKMRSKNHVIVSLSQGIIV